MKLLFSFPDTNLIEFYKFYKGLAIESLGYKKAYLIVTKDRLSMVTETNYFNSLFCFTSEGLKIVDFQLPKNLEEEFNTTGKVVYKVDLPKLLVVVEKFITSAPKEHVLTLLFQEKSLLATNSFKKNKIQIPITLEDPENYEEIEEKVDKFIQRFVVNPKPLDLNDSEVLDKLIAVKNMSLINSTKSNAVELTDGLIKYGDNYSIVTFKDKEVQLQKEEEIKLCTETITFLSKSFATLLGLKNIEVSESNKFLSITSPHLKGIYAQKPQVFNFPAADVLDWISPTTKEGWEFKFSGNTFKKEIINFKSLFSENAWKWQPIAFKINRNDKEKIILEYQDPTAREEVELPITEAVFRGFEEIEEYKFYVPSQIVSSILSFGLERLSEGEEKTTGQKFKEHLFQMNVVPISELEMDENAAKFKGFIISLPEAGMDAIFCKVERH